MTDKEYPIGLGPPPPPPVFSYRLYHDDNGIPLVYSMEDLPGKYIEVDRETLITAPMYVRVVDGQLKYLKTSTILKLQPSDTGTPCHPTNVSIVVDEAEPHTKWILK